ncbi:L-threonylcarbamoyladenylate synthase [Gloeobacter kilaueensis]|uniref:L-threonylcarbamoyladenylate synthase n=1 Tax=Gloeobacter kilaueensis (strain ATCC BAA-2537 / CCAP 1431/1 / ULC 316 / JS1) TaxID=1183438 RepID=U5QJ09_GLOK1|nr:L-threonylcarbamoyladenylate synthase [Gloeobacter kilaueensis]AGY58838.1 Sua5/YciO/YrdC/YwlC family protein [Gloeobacter kilaueensis JS1]
MSVLFISETAFLAHLRAGGVGVLPTDTVPGLVCLPQYADGIYALKGRDENKPLILLGAETADLKPFTNGWLPEWAALTARGWPGPLTLALPASDRVLPQLHRNQQTIGLRVPAHAATRALLALSGPLASTSANRSGEPALLEPEAIRATFAHIPLLVGDYSSSGIASTVVRWQIDGWQVLRQGNFWLEADGARGADER